MSGASTTIARWLIETGWQVTLLVALVLLAEAVLGRILTPRWRFGLWLLVVARLAIPWSPELDAGLLRWRVDSVTRPIPAWVEPPTSRRTADPTPPRGGTVAPRGDGAALSPLRSSPSLPDRASPPAEPRRAFDPTALVVGAWLAGLLALLGRDLLREIRFRRRLGNAAPTRNEALLALVEEGRRAVGLRVPVETLETDLVGAPAVFGVRRPRLLVPPGIAASLSDEALRPIVLHELFHVRHRDVAANLVLAVLRAVHWFHPLVHLALRRLVDARESVRDWQALSRSAGRSPRRYAETLLKLASPPSAVALGIGPRGRDLRRRILMITAFDRLSKRAPLAAAAGAALVASLGWITFTQAAPPAVLPELGGRPAGEDGLRRVECERETPPPPWRAPMERKLDATVDVDLRDVTFEEAIRFVREATALNVVVEEDVLGEFGDAEVTLVAEDLRARDLLTIACRAVADADLGFALADGVVVVGARDELPDPVDMRLYRLDPFLSGVPEADRTRWIEDVMALTTSFTEEREEWMRPGTSIETWNGLLVVVQTDEMHARTEEFLNLLLNRGRRPNTPPPAWRVALERRLEQPTSVVFEETWIHDAVRQLQATQGVPIVAPPDDHTELSLTLSDVPLRTVLEWVARRAELRIGLEDGAVVLGRSLPFRNEIYEVGDLVRAGTDEARSLRNHLVDMIRMHVDPESWDEDPRLSIAPAGRDLLCVRQSEAAHARIRSMFAAMRRALDRDG